MDVATFWRLIETSHTEARGDIEQQIARLTAAVAALEPDEIVAFDRLFRAQMNRAYRWDLWAAASIINGGCSDDGFEYFRAWLIAHHRPKLNDEAGDNGSRGREQTRLQAGASVQHDETCTDRPTHGCEDVPPRTQCRYKDDANQHPETYPDIHRRRRRLFTVILSHLALPRPSTVPMARPVVLIRASNGWVGPDIGWAPAMPFAR